VIVICDIDSTIANQSHREGLIAEAGWDAYHQASPADPPIQEMIALVNALNMAGHRIICLTGRPEKWRGITMTWLVQHDVHFHDLWMRPDDDYRPGKVMKIEYTRAQLGDLSKVGLVLEDVEDIAAAWRTEGVTTLLVHARRAG